MGQDTSGIRYGSLLSQTPETIGFGGRFFARGLGQFENDFTAACGKNSLPRAQGIRLDDLLKLVQNLPAMLRKVSTHYMALGHAATR